jgi:transcriptional regulator with XRE-family HTH domain
LKLLQKDVAKQLGVCQPCVYNWESNRSQPDIRYIPAVVRFLGYDPLPDVETLGAQLVLRRTALGSSQKEAAKRIGVDPGTLARWERGEREPAGRFLDIVKRFLNEDAACGAPGNEIQSHRDPAARLHHTGRYVIEVVGRSGVK